MTQRVLIFIFCLNSVLLNAQEREEYYSSEEKEYYSNRSYEYFKPNDKEILLNKSFYGITVKEIESFSNYVDSIYATPYQDSIMKVDFEFMQRDSFHIAEWEFLGGINKWNIIKYEKKENIEAFIYRNSEFENLHFGSSGIWLAISTNSGKDWKYIYTGIATEQPYYLKWYSDIPLIKNENTLQIEACILQQISPFSHPGPGPEYKLIKDGIALEFNLAEMLSDRDNDGLTDIVERKFMTNPESQDTDQDGISDNLDLNPRIDVPETEFTLLYEAIINERMSFDTTLIPFDMERKTAYANDTTQTLMIVTDDVNIKSIKHLKSRIIILTKAEYEKYKTEFENSLNDIHISPLFKVDNMENTYKVHFSIDTVSMTYLIIKKEDGWEVVTISWIIA